MTTPDPTDPPNMIDGLMIAPTQPVELPAEVPAWLRPYRGPDKNWLPASLLSFAAHTVSNPDRYNHDMYGHGWDDRDRLQDAYCRAALAMVASTGHDADLSVRQTLWCGMPLVGGYVAALAVKRTWLAHLGVAGDYRLEGLLDDVIRRVWPTPRSVAATGNDTLHAAMHLHRHLRQWYGEGGAVQKHEVNTAIDDVFRVGAATAGQQRQVALWHLTRNAFNAVRTVPARGRFLAEALLEALPAETQA